MKAELAALITGKEKSAIQKAENAAQKQKKPRTKLRNKKNTETDNKSESSFVQDQINTINSKST